MAMSTFKRRREACRSAGPSSRTSCRASRWPAAGSAAADAAGPLPSDRRCSRFFVALCPELDLKGCTMLFIVWSSLSQRENKTT